MNPRSLPQIPREMGFYLNGRMVPIASREVNEILSPGHGVPVTRIPWCTAEDLDQAVVSAREAFDDRRWCGMSGAERSDVLLRTAALIRARIDDIAYWETLENGKPISQSRAEIQGCVGMFEFAAGLARALHGQTYNNSGDGAFGVVTREPIGVVGVITPWNFPFLISCERVPYILASGCSIVAKPSEFTSTTTLMLAEILTEAGLPDGIYNVVTGHGETVGQHLAEHRDVDMLSFTGSASVGRSIIAASGKSNFKKLALELGGKNPQLVFADANLADAADGVAFGLMFNGGQCCVSGSRLLVERSVADQFVDMLIKKLAKIRLGDPLDEQTQVGAITTAAQYERILSCIATGQQEGATLVCGGQVKQFEGPASHGRYIEPTVFTNTHTDMRITREEIFGPVLCVMPFDTIEQAIGVANDTEYGLAASVWTQNLDTALTVSRRVQAGRFWVNTTLAGGPELPIGGFKSSGWGREAGMHGVEEYTQLKSTHIALGKRQHWIN